MKRKGLAERYPPSPPCACDTCSAYCSRPGWWTVKGAAAAIERGHARRMMLEPSPTRAFGVLSPAFKGNEGYYALDEFSERGCNFLMSDGRCELHGSGVQPLECRFCHHDRRGLGPRCHRDLEKDWDSPAGRGLVTRWAGMMGLVWPIERST